MIAFGCSSLYMPQRQHRFLLEFFLTTKRDQTLREHFHHIFCQGHEQQRPRVDGGCVFCSSMCHAPW